MSILDCGMNRSCPSLAIRLGGGVLVVGAAGNKNQGTQTSLEKAHYNTVTNHPTVIQVGAILPGLLSHFHDISYDGRSLDIVVPGWLFYGNLYSAGTSNSAALAAGMIANFWSEHPELSHYQVKKRIIEPARDMVFDLKADSIFWRIGALTWSGLSASSSWTVKLVVVSGIGCPLIPD